MAYTYTTLIGDRDAYGSIKNWIKHDKIDPTLVLDEAEQFIYSELRIWEMMKKTEVVCSEGDSVLPLPSEFIAPIWLRLDGDSRDLPFLQENLLPRYRDSDGDLYSGRPTGWTIQEGEIQFDLEADEDLNGTFAYYGRLDALSSSNPTGVLTTKYMTLLRSACTAIGYHHVEDLEAHDKHMRFAMNEIGRINVANEAFRHGQIMR